MEQQKILDELAEIQRMIAEYLEILGSEKKLRGVIVRELKEVQKDFGDERRTQIIEDTGEIKLEDLVQREDVAVTVTRGGYLKRTPSTPIGARRAAARAASAWARARRIWWSTCIVASTHTYLLIFTNKGRVYWLKIYEIPDAGTTGKGKNINGLINLQPDETVKAFLPVKEFVADKYIVMVTKHGVIKKCELTEFDNPMSRGIIAVSLDEGDELIAARLTTGQDYIFLGSHEGMAVRFKEDEVRAMGRPARGVRAMDLAEGDYIVGVEIVGEEDLILSISENGFGKRTPVERVPSDRSRRQGRHAHEDDQPDRQSGERPLGEGRHRTDDHHPERQDDSHRFQHDPPGRPLHAGRQAGHVWKRAIAWPRHPASRIRNERQGPERTGRADSNSA